jgi:hypothetical protein
VKDMVFDMAQANDEAFLKKYGTYKPEETTIPIRTIKPITLGESPEAAAARLAERRSQRLRRDTRLRKLLILLPVRSLVLLKLKSAKASLILSQNTKVTQT